MTTPQSISDKTVLGAPQSSVITSNLQETIVALTDAVHTTVHLGDQPAVSSMESLEASTAVKTFPLRQLFEVFLYVAT